VKLPLLLSQYLREHHQLRLPGLGSFYASRTAATGDADTQTAIDVRFERGNVKDADEQFLEFIKQKTGKIRPLALADLDSYIESGLQLLNIGKPFYIDGIGTIVKTREGKYEFVARELAAREENNGHAAERTERATYAEKARPVEKKKSVFEDEKYSPSANPWQKLVVAALILGGLAVVVLGGYYLYTQKNDKAEIQQQVIPVTTDSTNTQDTLTAPRIDTTQSMASYASMQSGSYKFVLETTNSKKRAMRRFEQLKSYMLPIKMETPDSVSYKLYFLIPSTPADTSRIKDSLSRYYLSKVKIEL
jgi:hypothetical protein